MKTPISGFTIIRNAELMDYPLIESIKSALPLVDEFVVALGQSDDRTRELIEAINDPKIRIEETFWDPKVQKGGQILSIKTNEALEFCKNDWCLYLQADEVLHEQDLITLKKAVEKAGQDSKVEGFLFNYVHFYGSHSVIATSRKWYRREVRLVRKSSGIQSIGDAQSFSVEGRKPFVRHSGARIFHYGWVKPPQSMGQKKKLLDRLWHGNKKDDENDQFQFEKIYGLKPFKGSHPAAMIPRVQAQDWKFHHQRSWADFKSSDVRLVMSDWMETCFNHRFGEYKPFQLLKE